MSKQDQRELHISIIEYLKTQYLALNLPCFALCISYHYRCLSKISQMEKNEHIEKEKFWFHKYLDNRCDSKMIRSMLLDRVIDSHYFLE